jgi:hypothetical protein
MKAKIGLAAVGFLGLVTVLGVAWAQTAPQLINYQGRLADSAGQPLADGSTVDLTFKFYGLSSGQTPLYLTALQEDVVVTHGLYSVLIGSGTITPGTEHTLAEVFQKHPAVWMGVSLDADAEMNPRSRIASSPFALATDLAQIDKFMRAADFDGDGHNKDYIYAGDDCNDTDPSVHPGAADNTKDGIDQDCDGFDGNHCEGLADGSACPGGRCCGEVCRVGADCCQNADCGCGGNADPCMVFMPPTQCYMQLGCFDGSMCMGPPGCEMNPFEAPCNATPGCFWWSQCAGSPMPCDFFDPSSCSLQIGCVVETCGAGYVCQ